MKQSEARPLPNKSNQRRHGVKLPIPELLGLRARLFF
jgi:hypothetical protein